MYNVQIMKRYPVSVARERLADVLDEADRTGGVVIERRGVQYMLTPKVEPKRAPARRASRIEVVDPAVDSGNWTWDWSPDGPRFVSRRS